ncbi:hypothetical protein K6Y31_02910 [Motilimonas cestriensis]|uniref:Uncharacterized protein n=1 Tax=Motilimonas cestriensis TaxID=2742685 RepID=A0ABS8W5U2_9GAMM|nr:hypothetical protein [Motilimonas cestriensis]MCE2593762.1 hypothetical protein [Motilimonas cestriensis]
MVENEVAVSELVSPDEYRYHFNRVAGVTTKRIIYLKKKFASKSGFEFESFPIADCSTIKYKAEYSLLTVVTGVVVVCILLLLFLMLYLYGDSLAAGQTAPLGAIVLASLYGIRKLFGAKRHRLTFMLNNGHKLEWLSKAGHFDNKEREVKKVVSLAKRLNILCRVDGV